MYISTFSKKDLSYEDVNLKIGPTLRIQSELISIQALGTGELTVEISVDEINFEQLDIKFALPGIITIGNMVVGNSISCKTSGTFESLTYNL